MKVWLIPLKRENLETVRTWRNQVHVREMMEFREIISPLEQEKWFNSLDPLKNSYFIFRSKRELIGLIYLKNFFNNEAEAGIFVGEKKYKGTGIAVYASLAILDYAFDVLKLKKVFAKVNKNNSVAIQYNSFLGFTVDSAINDIFIKMSIDEQGYQKKRKKIIEIITTN